jgi:hypothetical protein
MADVMGALPRCSTVGCEGHLGKFQDCLSEALWEISLYAGESTGSTEAYGHFTLIHVEENETHVMGAELGQDPGGPTVAIPAGWYMVQASESGAVYTWRCPSEAEALGQFSLAGDEYSEWLNINEPDPLAANAGSAD